MIQSIAEICLVKPLINMATAPTLWTVHPIVAGATIDSTIVLHRNTLTNLCAQGVKKKWLNGQSQGSDSWIAFPFNLTVPGKLSGEAWRHLLASIEQFEKSKSISVIDLDMQRAPIEPIE